MAASDTSAMTRRYDMLRNRAKADVASQTTEQDDALKRRFAALGNLNSGAALKQQQLTKDRGAQLQQKATEGVDMAQMQEQAQLDEADRGRAFQTSERLGSQAYGTNERLGSQSFASGEREAGQAFSAGESEKARGLQDRQFNASLGFEKSKWGQQFGETVRMNNLEEKIQKFNMEMANDAANQKSMFDRAGNLATSFWQSNSGGGWMQKASSGVSKANPTTWSW